jgi:hypothetical protein
MAEIVEFGGVTRLPSDPARVLARAADEEFESVVVVGFRKDGSEFFASSEADGGNVLWLLERAKLKLVSVPETHFGVEGCE